MKTAIAALALFALTGCATYQQSGTLAGAAVGAATGRVLGGDTGAVIGAVIGAQAGSNVGSSMDHQRGITPAAPPLEPRTFYVPQREIYYVPPPSVVYINPWYAAPGPYWRWSYHSSLGWGYYNPHRSHFHFHYHHHHRHHRRH